MINCLRRNKKGTVLFTVIVVMMVLIITMMSTMVVVVTAQKKSITNFTDSQSYVTAKGIIDIFVDDLTNMDPGATASAKLRETLIGKFTPGTGGNPDKMVGGLDYVDSAHESDRDAADSPKTKYTTSMDVTATVNSTTPVQGIGQILDNKITVARLDRYTFKVTITVLDGTEFDASGVLKKSQNSSKTVSRIIKLTSSPSASVFDSSLISCSGSTELFSDSQLYGGYVNATPGTNVTKLNGGTNYIGRIFSKGTMQLGDDSRVDVYLSTRKMIDLTSGADAYYLDYFESQTGIHFTGNLFVHNIIPSGESTSQRKPDGIANPYIFGSGSSSSYVTIGYNSPTGGSASYTASQIGDSSTSPVDIYANGNVNLCKVTMYGNIYCKGKVKIENSTINGKIYCNTKPDAATIACATGGWEALGSTEFPDGYSMNTYMDVSALLGEEYLKKSQTYQRPGASTNITIGDCFAPSYPLPADPVQTITATNGATTVIKPSAPLIPSMPGSPDTMVPNVVKSGNVIARTANLTLGGEPFSGQIIIELGEEDLFFKLTNYCGNPNTSMFSDSAKIIIQPKSGIAESDLGNVYMYSNLGGFLNSGLEVFTDFNRNGIYDDSVKQFGTKELSGAHPTPSLELPSHFFWIMDGNGTTLFQNTALIHGYVYGKGCEMGGAQYNGEAKGVELTNAAYYDDHVMPMAHDTTKKPTPVYVGSCISARNTIGGYSSSIFVPPPTDNIFDGAIKITLDKYAWNTGMYNNR